MKHDPLLDAKSKVERANTHIRDAVEQSNAFFVGPDRLPHYTSFRELDPDGTREYLKIRIIAEPPRQFAAAIGDAVTNLRSALDYLTCELAIQNGVNDLRGVEFPFAHSREEFELARTQKKIKKLSADAVELIRSLKPYGGGNDVLWALNALRKPNIHHHLVVAAVSVTNAGGDFRLVPGIGYHRLSHFPHFRPLDREIRIIAFTPGSKLEYNLEVGMHIVFRDIETLEGEDSLAVVQKLADVTTRILTTFEDRFF